MPDSMSNKISKLVDPCGRVISHLRISLTQRCNLSCFYCHREGEDDPGDEISTEKIIEIIDGIESNIKLSIMVDAHRVAEQVFKPVDESPIDIIRVATYVKDIDKARQSHI